MNVGKLFIQKNYLTLVKKMLDNNKLVYLPAVLPNRYVKEGEVRKNNFWQEDSLFKYPYMLISAFYGLDHVSIRDKLKIPEDTFLFSDSGGFQVVTLDGYVDPKKLIHWQEENSQAGVILDYPPYSATNSAAFGGTPSLEFFRKCMKKTCDNSTIMLENKKSEKFKLYGVVQGDTFNQAEEWFKEMLKVESNCGEFGGWALSPKPSEDPIRIAMMGLLMLKYQIKKPLHILQVSGRAGIFIAALIRKLTGNTVTIDSSTFAVAARYGSIIDPDKIPNLIKVGRSSEHTLKKWLCDCPVCTKLKPDIRKEFPSEILQYLDLHNLYHLIKLTNYADSIVEDEVMFQDKVNTLSGRAQLAIKLLQTPLESIDKVIHQYGNYFNKIERIKQRNLFGVYK